MKNFVKYLVIVLTVLFFSAIVFAATPKKADVKKVVAKVIATATEVAIEVVTEKMVIVKSSPTVTTVKIQDPQTETTNVSVTGDQTVEYRVSGQEPGLVLNENTLKKIGTCTVQTDKKVVQKNSIVGEIEFNYDDNNKPCEVVEKETWQKILWGDENKKSRLNIRFQLAVGVKTTDNVSDTANGIKTSEAGDDLALFEGSGQLNLTPNIAIQGIRMFGRRIGDVQVMGMSLGGLSISETTVLMKWYPGEVFGVNPYFGIGARFVHIDGGYNMGAIPVDVSGNETIIGTRFGLEAPVTSKWAIDIWGEYFKSKIIADLPQAGKSSTETTGRAGLGVIRYF